MFETCQHFTGVLIEIGTAYPSRAPRFNLWFLVGFLLPPSFQFMCCVFAVRLCSVSCNQCFLCLWIAHSWLPVWFSLALFEDRKKQCKIPQLFVPDRDVWININTRVTFLICCDLWYYYWQLKTALISVLVSSVVDCRFEPRSGKTKDC